MRVTTWHYELQRPKSGRGELGNNSSRTAKQLRRRERKRPEERNKRGSRRSERSKRSKRSRRSEQSKRSEREKQQKHGDNGNPAHQQPQQRPTIRPTDKPSKPLPTTGLEVLGLLLPTPPIRLPHRFAPTVAGGTKCKAERLAPSATKCGHIC